MTHIIITAGGTSEPIDGVRKISNTSTGSLCACIYEAISEYLSAHAAQLEKNGDNSGFLVHYVATATAIRPEVKENLPVLFYPVTDVSSTCSVLEALLTSYKIRYVIHGMAVSDFKKGYLIERDALAEELARTIGQALKNSRGDVDMGALKETICGVMEHPVQTMDSGSKVSSQSDPILSLVKTQKIISKIKKWAPDTFLVGFKLLKNASEEELIRAAAELTRKNGCDLVLANDANKIREGEHFGLLVKEDRIVERFLTKREIAKGIAEHLFGRC